MREGRPSRVSSADNPVYVLDAEEHAALRAIERGAVLRSAGVGAVSGLVCGAATVWAGSRWEITDATRLADLAAYWGFQGGVTIVASVAEIIYLYWDALISVRRLAHAAGLDLHGAPSVVGATRHGIATALARTALELPDPHAPVYGVDPRRESSAVALLLASIAYKAKIGVSTFVLKALVRRALGRIATRQLLAFAALPVNAIWNAVVTFLVLREARIRAMGPSAVEALVPDLIPDPSRLSIEARKSIARAAAAAIVRTECAHPNLVLFLRRILERVGPLGDRIVLDDTALFVEHARTLDEAERCIVIRVAIAGAVLDGRTGASETRLLTAIFAVLGERPDDATTSRVTREVAEVERLRRAFVHGRPFSIPRRQTARDLT